MATYWSDMYWRKTCVYRFYDADDQLLYVGLSANPAGRFTKHKRRDWWPAVARCEIEWFSDREAAQSAERIAIHHEKPIHNVVRARLECC